MDVFAALADPVRRDLLRELAVGRARVVDLARGRPISRPAVSKHLRLLTEAGLVVADAVGRERHYGIRPEGLAPVAGFLEDLTPAVPRPPVDARALEGLDLEVRRVGRDHAATRTTAAPTAPAAPRTEETA
jgi:DNA-binding transcriptional ArsR family regulator